QGGSERAPEREGAWADGDGELGFLRVGGGEPEDGAAGEAGRADDEGDRRDVAGADRFFAQADAFLRGALGAVAVAIGVGFLRHRPEAEHGADGDAGNADRAARDREDAPRVELG